MSSPPAVMSDAQIYVEAGVFTQRHNSTTMSDIIVCYHDRKLNAHKVVLGSHSKWFDKAFTSGFKESSEKQITLHEDDPLALDGMFAYMYGVNIAFPKLESSSIASTSLDAIMFCLQLFWVADKYNCQSLIAALPKMIDSWLPELLSDLCSSEEVGGLAFASAESEKIFEVLAQVVRGLYETGDAGENIRATFVRQLFKNPKSSPIELGAELSDPVTEVAREIPEFAQDLFVAMMDRKGERKGNGWSKIVELRCYHRNMTYYGVQGGEKDKPCGCCGAYCQPMIVT